MKTRNTIIITIVIIFIFIIVDVFLLSKKEALEATRKDTAPAQENLATDAEKQVVNTNVNTPGIYEIYSPEKITWAKDKKVILFFKASWCPTCRAVDADIKMHLATIPHNVAILEVDYDTTKELKQRYGVTYQHTFVQVDENGRMLAKWSGSPTLNALLEEIK